MSEPITEAEIAAEDADDFDGPPGVPDFDNGEDYPDA